MSKHTGGDMPRHGAFILRLWETRSVPPDPDAQWRLSLEDVHTGEKHKFRDVDRMSAFLKGRMGLEENPMVAGPEGDTKGGDWMKRDDTGVDGQWAVETAERPLLIISQDQAVREQLRTWLEATLPGRPIEEAEGARTALARMQAHPPDFVLVDTLSAGNDDAETVRRLRAGAPGARIVALAREGAAGEVCKAGADVCLPPWRSQEPDLLAQARSTAKPRELPGRTVVCIEDEPDMISLIKLALERHQVNLIGALGGREGLEKVREVRPDLVLLDLMMPDVNGAEVLEHLKADENLRDIPVIILTVLDLRYGAKQGVDPTRIQGYIRKPFVPRKLIETVDAALQVVA